MFDQSSESLIALTPARRRVVIIHNPASGVRNGQRLNRFAAALAVRGLLPTVRRTRCAGDAQALASTVDRNETDLLTVAGGDGTINEVINGLSLPAPQIGLLPLGTANVLAAELGIPADCDALGRVLAEGRTVEACVPEANGLRFMMMAGVGFDAHVVAAVDVRQDAPSVRQRTLSRSFARCGVSPTGGTGWWLMAARIRRLPWSLPTATLYGGRFTCTRDARLDRPELHVCLFHRSDLECRPLWPGASAGLHRRADVSIRRARQVTVLGEAGEPVHCDGDIVTSLPLTVTATEAKLRFIAGAGCR